MVKCYICSRKHFFSFITYLVPPTMRIVGGFFLLTERIKAYICRLFDKYGGGCGYQIDGCTLFISAN